MSDIAVRAENISKLYRLGETAKYDTLRDQLAEGVRTLFSRRKSTPKHGDNLVWALKDIGFELKRGEVLGIIGRNGAGKSTLLKILSRITAPTSGMIELNGRVGSLLEVGTGFHQELTGRENIFMNGAILGMTRQEIKRKFDEIVEFAGVEPFIDTPVKRFSSGMQVRLAFAVAAHIEPEILIVDEVLAVGDAAFQRKCLGKMSEVASEGRTVLFVSHNMRTVQHLCTRTIYLDGGQISDDGPTNSVVRNYVESELITFTLGEFRNRVAALSPDPSFRLLDIDIIQDSQTTVNLWNGDPVELVAEYEILEPVYGFRIWFDLLDTDENHIFRTFHDHKAEEIHTIEPGKYRSSVIIPPNILADRTYNIAIGAGIHEVRYCLPREGLRIPVTVMSNTYLNRAYSSNSTNSLLWMEFNWETQRI
jgi:lipopolysaccharide transport system ATP-binding protein